MIITKKLKIKVNNRYVKYYKERGYDIKGGDEIEIDINDLPENSHCEIQVLCSYCRNIKTIKRYNYVDDYCCKDCKKYKTEKTNIKKYGVKSTLLTNNVKEKTKNYMVDKYGVDHYSKTDEFKEKILTKTNGKGSTLLLEENKIKTKNTLMKKYGVDHYSKTNDFKQKLKNKSKEKYGVDHYSKTEKFKDGIIEKTINRYKKKYNVIKYTEAHDDNFKLTILCDKCGKQFKINRSQLKNREKYKTVICTECNPINSFSNSGMELQLLDFIKTIYKGEIILNNRKIIYPYEIDIYLPEEKIAFEFNGLWWHNELYKPKDYHQKKSDMCRNKNINLFQIWEDDWLYKGDVVKSIIKNYIERKEIYLKDCEIKTQIENKICENFLNKNNIEGFIKSDVKIAIINKKQLIGLFCFKETKKGLELVRFVSNFKINGLDKYFDSIGKNIECKINNNYFNSVLMDELKWKYINSTDPNVYCVKDGKRISKLEENCNKIYDSGSLVYIKNLYPFNL
jgi:hypothetical protein